jgi:hypothetical protein
MHEKENITSLPATSGLIRCLAPRTKISILLILKRLIEISSNAIKVILPHEERQSEALAEHCGITGMQSRALKDQMPLITDVTRIMHSPCDASIVLEERRLAIVGLAQFAYQQVNRKQHQWPLLALCSAAQPPTLSGVRPAQQSALGGMHAHLAELPRAPAGPPPLLLWRIPVVRAAAVCQQPWQTQPPWESAQACNGHIDHHCCKGFARQHNNTRFHAASMSWQHSDDTQIIGLEDFLSTQRTMLK